MDNAKSIVDAIFFIIVLFSPIVFSIALYISAKKSYRNSRQKYGKKHAIPYDIFYDYSFSRTLIIEITLSLMIIIAFAKFDVLYLYSLKAYVILIPVATLALALITIVYGSKNEKYLFFTEREIIKSKGTDIYVKGILLTLFANICFSAVIKISLIDNKIFCVILMLINIIISGLCLLFSIYVCWAVANTTFSDAGAQKLLKRLNLIFDMYSVDLSVVQQLGINVNELRVSNNVYYLTDNYLNSYKKIKGDNIKNISCITYFDKLSTENKKKWKKHISLKYVFIYCLLSGVLSLSLFSQQPRYLWAYFIIHFAFAIVVGIIAYKDFDLQRAFSGNFGYLFEIEKHGRKIEKIIGYNEPFSFPSKYKDFITNLNSLIAGCLIILHYCHNYEVAEKSIINGVEMMIEHGDENLSFKMLPFSMIDKIFYDSCNGEHFLNPEKYVWIGDDNYQEFLQENKIVLLRNIGDQLSIKFGDTNTGII